MKYYYKATCKGELLEGFLYSDAQGWPKIPSAIAAHHGVSLDVIQMGDMIPLPYPLNPPKSFAYQLGCKA
jgi:hypothetical protein